MHPVHDSVQARPHRRSSPEISPRHVSPGHVSFSITNPQVPPLWLSPAYPTAIVRLRLIAFNLPRQWCGWVGKKQISLSRFSPVALTALSTSFVTSAYSVLAQCVDTLNDSTDSLARIFFAQSNGGIQLLEFRLTNYSDHVLYHFCTIFRYSFPVPHSGNGHLTFGSLPSGKSLGGSCVSPDTCSMHQQQLQLQQQHACRFMHAGSCIPVHPACTQQ